MAPTLGTLFFPVSAILLVKGVKKQKEKVTKEVLMNVNETKDILRKIQCRKHYWIGHIVRCEGYLHIIIDGKMMQS